MKIWFEHGFPPHSRAPFFSLRPYFSTQSQPQTVVMSMPLGSRSRSYRDLKVGTQYVVLAGHAHPITMYQRRAEWPRSPWHDDSKKQST